MLYSFSVFRYSMLLRRAAQCRRDFFGYLHRVWSKSEVVKILNRCGHFACRIQRRELTYLG